MEKLTRGDIDEGDNSIQRSEYPHNDKNTVDDAGLEDGGDKNLLIGNNINSDLVDDGYNNTAFGELESIVEPPSLQVSSLCGTDKTSEYNASMSSGRENVGPSHTLCSKSQTDYYVNDDDAYDEVSVANVPSWSKITDDDAISQTYSYVNDDDAYDEVSVANVPSWSKITDDDAISYTYSYINDDDDYDEVSVVNMSSRSKSIQDDATHHTDSCDYEDMDDDDRMCYERTHSILTLTEETIPRLHVNQPRPEFGEEIFRFPIDDTSPPKNVFKGLKTRKFKYTLIFCLVASISVLAILLTVCFVRINEMEQSISKLTSKQDTYVFADDYKSEEFTSSKNNSESSSLENITIEDINGNGSKGP